jgi:hypothetical protein
MFTVPDDVLATPCPFAPAYTLPIIEHDCPVVRLDVKQLATTVVVVTTPPAVTVSVMPLVGTNPPPAVTPVADALLMLSTVGDVSIVTV